MRPPIIDDNQRTFMLSSSRVIARNVFTIDWDMPASMGRRLYIVQEQHELAGLRGDGQTMWIAPMAYRLRNHRELMDYARLRGFELRYHYEHPRFVDPHFVNEGRHVDPR